MTFHSILLENMDAGIKIETPEAPAFFTDLNLDQIIDAVIEGKKEYDLKPFFYTPISDLDTIYYRHEIMRDMENEVLLASIQSFAEKMVVVRRYLRMIEKQRHRNHREGLFLDTVIDYCAAVSALTADLRPVNLTSRGLKAFRDYLTAYANADQFKTLEAQALALKSDLSTVKYAVIIKDNAVRVRKYEDETDYSVEVLDTFEKFKQGNVKDYRIKLPDGSGMNHVEAQILDCVARLYPEIFSKLHTFCAQRSQFVDETIRVFDREIQFYLSYLTFIANFKTVGLAFCYPQMSVMDKEICDEEGFDLALAHKLYWEKSSVVTNDFYLKDPERIIIVSGPNQGGKTTFARTFGQLHYLASLGCPVPGKRARLFLYDSIFTHFEKEENIKNLRGKLQDDLMRIAKILDQATPKSIIIMNEIFTSTTLNDAVFLSKKIMKRIIELDLLCVYVTFLDELASFSQKTVSMVSTIVPENPSVRTFKILRRPADGLSYAISIAEKHQLTYERLKERIKP